MKTHLTEIGLTVLLCGFGIADMWADAPKYGLEEGVGVERTGG